MWNVHYTDVHCADVQGIVCNILSVQCIVEYAVYSVQYTECAVYSGVTDMQFVTNFTRIEFQNICLPKKHVNYGK